MRLYVLEHDDGVVEGDSTERFQLAARIADVFDRYQFYRPQLLRDWGAGKDGQWQALNELCADRDKLAATAVDDFMALLVA